VFATLTVPAPTQRAARRETTGAGSGARHWFVLVVVSIAHCARTVQGAAAAMLVPAALGTLITTYSGESERGRAFAVFGAVSMAGGAIGLILGGVLTEYLSWRWCMYVNVLFGAVALVGALAYLPDEKPAHARIDLVDAARASIGLFALVFGFSRTQPDGWSSGITIGSLAIGVALLVSFVLAERNATQPLLLLRVVTDRSRATAFTAVGIASAAMFVVLLFLTYYLQLVKGFSPLKSGVAFLPLIVCIALSAAIANIVTLPRFGPRAVVTAGMALAFLGLAYLSRLDVHSSHAAGVLPALILVGLGNGSVIAPSMNTATAGVQTEDSGVASALVSVMQQVGGAIGAAVMTTIAVSATNSYTSSHPAVLRHNLAAATHGDAVMFRVTALVFAVGGLLAVAFFPSKAPSDEAPTADPASLKKPTSRFNNSIGVRK
jgi:MFS family permease